MLGAAGAIAPETLRKLGMRPAETALPWFKTGAIPPAGTCAYWADPYTLFVLEMALMGFAAHRRFQDWAKPGTREAVLLRAGLCGLGDPAYPEGPFFNPFGFGKDDNFSALSLFSFLFFLLLGFLFFSLPFCCWFQPNTCLNLLDHLADPVHNNILTSLNFH
ncbi:unnamed protein product [Musa hybrid cultivar]